MAVAPIDDSRGQENGMRDGPFPGTVTGGSMKGAVACRVLSLIVLSLLIASKGESDPPGCEAFSAWSAPVNLGSVVNSTSLDSAATLSPDGLSLYFVSTRPGGQGSNDIWVSQRRCADCPWEAPANLKGRDDNGFVIEINSPFVDGGPSLSTDGHLLFFHSFRPGGHGGSDIWVSYRSNPNDDFGWGPPVNLGPEVNTSASEFNPDYLQSADFYVEAMAGVPANAAALYFSRGPDVNNQNIYVVPVTHDGSTIPTTVAVLVDELSSVFNEAAPSVRTDGKEILFWSPRPGGSGSGDIWASTRAAIHEPWSAPENVGFPVNTTSNDVRPNLSRSGRTLLFDSNRPGGEGDQDIWMSTREPGCR
jgi:WD40-like Beta Propeller Repeat